MLFLIPPSETKTKGGSLQKFNIQSLKFDQLLSARQLVLGSTLESEELHLLPAVMRYSGTLYSAIHGRGLKGTPTEHNQLSDVELSIAGERVLIQSALFGLLSADDLIPDYKVSPTKSMDGLNLKRHWSEAHEQIWPQLGGEIVVDLRSKAYADLAPVSAESNSLTVTVFYRAPDGKLSQMNHFNKKAKGQLVRAVLQATSTPEKIADLCDLAADAGLELHHGERTLTLITKSAT